MQRRGFPLFYKFLSYVVNRELRKTKSSSSSKPTLSPLNRPSLAALKGEDIKLKKFFDEFVVWGRDGNYNRKAYTVSGFGADAIQLISDLDAVEPDQLIFKRKKKEQGMVYIVDWPKLQTHFKRTQKFDPQAAE
jgi:hypothetical protein